MPSVIGRGGVLSRIPVPLDGRERAALRDSAAALRSVIDRVV
jgi:malate/lactate dehydrogenase